MFENYVKYKQKSGQLIPWDWWLESGEQCEERHLGVKRRYLNTLLPPSLLPSQTPQSSFLIRSANLPIPLAENTSCYVLDLFQKTSLSDCREVAPRYRLRVALPLLTIFKEESPEVGPLAPVLPLR